VITFDELRNPELASGGRHAVRIPAWCDASRTSTAPKRRTRSFWPVEMRQRRTPWTATSPPAAISPDDRVISPRARVISWPPA